MDYVINGKQLSTLRVVDLKEELEKRKLSKSGTKKDLAERLRQALDGELAAANQTNQAVVMHEQQQQQMYQQPGMFQPVMYQQMMYGQESSYGQVINEQIMGGQQQGMMSMPIMGGVISNEPVVTHEPVTEEPIAAHQQQHPQTFIQTSNTGEHIVSQPIVNEPNACELIQSEPIVSEQPIVSVPVEGESMVSEPIIEREGNVAEQTTGQNNVSETVASEPAISEPDSGAKIVCEPNIPQEITSHPVAVEPIEVPQSTKESVVEQTTDESCVDHDTPNDPVVNQQIASEPIMTDKTEKAVEPASEEPVEPIANEEQHESSVTQSTDVQKAETSLQPEISEPVTTESNSASQDAEQSVEEQQTGVISGSNDTESVNGEAKEVARSPTKKVSAPERQKKVGTAVTELTKEPVEVAPMKNDVPKIPPAKNAPSRFILVNNLVRPFTLKKLQDLLEASGHMDSDNFWIDKIKSKCIACFETIEQATKARESLHGLRWPDGNPKTLVVDFTTQSGLDEAREKENPKATQSKTPTTPIVPANVPLATNNNHKDTSTPSSKEKPDKRDVIIRTIKNDDFVENSKPVREWDKEKLKRAEVHGRSSPPAAKRARSRSPAQGEGDTKERGESSCFTLKTVLLSDFSSENRYRRNRVAGKITG